MKLLWFLRRARGPWWSVWTEESSGSLTLERCRCAASDAGSGSRGTIGGTSCCGSRRDDSGEAVYRRARTPARVRSSQLDPRGHKVTTHNRVWWIPHWCSCCSFRLNSAAWPRFCFGASHRLRHQIPFEPFWYVLILKMLDVHVGKKWVCIWRWIKRRTDLRNRRLIVILTKQLYITWILFCQSAK